MCELNTLLHCVPVITMCEMMHISGQRPYVNTMQGQLLKLEYESGTQLSAYCQMYPKTIFMIV